jgi:hypothetical protein
VDEARGEYQGPSQRLWVNQSLWIYRFEATAFCHILHNGVVEDKVAPASDLSATVPATSIGPVASLFPSSCDYADAHNAANPAGQSAGAINTKEGKSGDRGDVSRETPARSCDNELQGGAQLAVRYYWPERCSAPAQPHFNSALLPQETAGLMKKTRQQPRCPRSCAGLDDWSLSACHLAWGSRRNRS